MIQRDEEPERERADVAHDEVLHREGPQERLPPVEEDEQHAEGEAVDGAEELAGGAVGVLGVLAVEGAAVLEGGVLGGALEPVEEADVGEADDGVDEEDGDGGVGGHAAESLELLAGTQRK